MHLDNILRNRKRTQARIPGYPPVVKVSVIFIDGRKFAVGNLQVDIGSKGVVYSGKNDKQIDLAVQTQVTLLHVRGMGECIVVLDALVLVDYWGSSVRDGEVMF